MCKEYLEKKLLEAKYVYVYAYMYVSIYIHISIDTAFQTNVSPFLDHTTLVILSIPIIRFASE